MSLGDRNLGESADKLCKAPGKMSLVGSDAKCHNGESVYKHTSLFAKEQGLYAASRSFPGGLSGPGSPAPPRHLFQGRGTHSEADGPQQYREKAFEQLQLFAAVPLLKAHQIEIVFQLTDAES